MGYYFHALFIFFIFSFASCKKENTTVNGKVWDLSYNKPLKGANVNLVERKSTLSFESANTKILSTATTDDNGNFEFVFHSKAKFRNSYTYYVEFGYDNGLYIYEYPGLSINDKVEIEKKQINNSQLNLAPAAEIKIISNNVNPYDNNDKITVFAKNINYSYEKPIFGYTGISQNVDMGYIKFFASDVILKWEVTKNNITTTYYDTVILSHNQKFDYVINY